MRICVLTRGTNPFGGMYRHTLDLVRGLVAAGHDVEVICPRVATAADLYGARWRMVDAPSDFGSDAWQRASTDEFLRMQRERPVDVVHAEGSSGLGLLRSAADRHAPVVVMFHGNYFGLVKAATRRARKNPTTAAREAKLVLDLSRRHFARGNATLFRRCEVIVPSRQQVRDTCRSHHLLRERVHVVPYGVDTDLWRPRPRDARDEVLFVGSGRLNPEKGFDVALRALQRVPGRLLVAGRGAEADPLRRLAAKLGVDDRFELLGALPPEELAALVGAADVYLLPTMREEAGPVVVYEALASGVPIVASRIGSIPEAIDRPGENGILVRPGSVDELADGMAKLVADSELRRAMGVAARARALEEFSLETMIERKLAVYTVAIERAAADAGAARAA